jgi:signal transduction histidine kinase
LLKLHLKYAFLTVLFVSRFYVFGQNFLVKEYKVEDGLPIDVMKAVNQDSLGFIWIATDDGLVKYDGQSFTSYKNQLSNRYLKAFLKTKSNKLIAIGDLDFVEIHNKLDTVEFTHLIRGSHTVTDSTISYPKAIFEDSEENIWLAEEEAIVKYKDGKMKRYNIGKEYRSSEFDRSFQFYENSKKQLFIIANNGSVFIFDTNIDHFRLLNYKLPSFINHVLNINDTLYIASNQGLFFAIIDDGGLKKISKKKFNYGYISKLSLAPDSALLVCTYSYDMFIFKRYNKDQYFKVNYEFNDIRSAYISKEGDYWVATHKGLILLQHKIFDIPYRDPKSKFIESIEENTENGKIYFCDKEYLSSLEKDAQGNWIKKDIFFLADGFFQTLAFNRNGLWASNAYSLMLFKNEKLFKKWDFQKYGYYIFDIVSDKNENVWLVQSKNKYLYQITPLLDTIRYKFPNYNGLDPTVLTISDSGIYIGCHGNKNHYLFYKKFGSNIIEDISLPLDIDSKAEFQITKLLFHQGILWIASTHGLYKYKNNKISKIDLGKKFSDFVITVVYQLDKDHILFSNSYGLFKFNINTEEYWIYDENVGLPANVITDHGIFIDSKQRVWIGSSVGLAYTNAENLLNNSPTPTPVCVGATVNGKKVRFTKPIFAAYGEYINLRFSSISFPEVKISYQWKFEGKNQDWQDFENNELKFSNLKSGKYVVWVRAKKNTGQSWSAPSSITLIIDKPFWAKLEFIVVVSILIILLVWLSTYIYSQIVAKREALLQQLVRERTTELEMANQELSIRNQELDRFVYSASHDLGAPLKSLLGLINLAKEENDRDTLDNYHNLMESSVKRLDEFIKEVISYSRNSRQELFIEEINFKNLVLNVIENLKYTDNFGLIDFRIDIETDEIIWSDITRLRIILNNLISNAIKFHVCEPDRKPFILVKLEKIDNNYQIVVEDNGRGIPSQFQSKIFDMFYRVAGDVQGSGLGLYILKETVDKLQGKVTVKSTEGVGTVFNIIIPIPSALSVKS